MNFTVDMGGILTAFLQAVLLGGFWTLLGRLKAMEAAQHALQSWQVGVEKDLDHLEKRVEGQSKFWSDKLLKKAMGEKE